MEESILHPQLFTILAMSDEPMDATAISKELSKDLRYAMTPGQVVRELTKIVDQYGGIPKGYTQGTIVRAPNYKWGVKTLGTEPFTPKRAIELML